MKLSTKLLAAAALATIAAGSIAPASASGNKKGFVVVDGDRGRVVYDDGRDDGGCVFRRAFAGYDWYGNPRFRKVYRCF